MLKLIKLLGIEFFQQQPHFEYAMIAQIVFRQDEIDVRNAHDEYSSFSAYR